MPMANGVLDVASEEVRLIDYPDPQRLSQVT